ncbi:MAG: hypothetical protein UY16_C0018G0005 [Candidatus Gottesmanbacteria bacterium GW2011_GWA2_47_9]|uniref:Uncharacterized protein n=1 Tax=Candidatus Gottesmanbacteria bacterium GW2011_GWA2_47_9 TaxID=1618445 RepID=A0A0G1X033_9BACT|nr:MAG: hypothetical protein UY16_C0018G0005 [Candidatus Gottesmanbacteria bacterium GW2011_GWA2_47_9]
MKFKDVLVHHRLFFYFLLLFVVVAAVDLFNLDRIIYKVVCDAVAPVSGSPCPPYYDIPIWHVYLSLAILAALYHVHGEIRVSNKHLSSRK